MVSDPLVVTGPAMAAFESASVAAGVVALDQLLKRAEVTVHASRTVSPGRYFVLIGGGEAEVGECMDAAETALADDRVDSLRLWNPSPGLLGPLAGRPSGAETIPEAMVLVETATLCGALGSADRCLKELDCRLLELRLGAGLAGKGVFTLVGPLPMMDAARAVIEAELGRRLIRYERIAQPHPDLPSRLLGAEGTGVRR